MKSIRTAILAVCLGTLGSLAVQAQGDDTAYGTYALSADTTGSINTAFGFWALSNNTTGTYNTGIGAKALWSNSGGYYNTAVGPLALEGNTTGNYNMAVGPFALEFNTYGSVNSGLGFFALHATTTGGYNTAVGPFALENNTVGTENIGVGYAAGYALPNWSSNNIDIVSPGGSNDFNTIRIGTSGVQSAFYAAGVSGVGVGSGVPVYINSSGQLGTANSSIRFKEDVHDMAAASDGLFRLRPVTFRYKKPYADGSKPIDYGLIAEEVATVYPDLVVKDADGQIQTVQYQKLTPMLLNEVQKEHRLLEEQEKTIQLLEKRLAALEAALPSAKLESRLETK